MIQDCQLITKIKEIEAYTYFQFNETVITINQNIFNPLIILYDILEDYEAQIEMQKQQFYSLTPTDKQSTFCMITLINAGIVDCYIQIYHIILKNRSIQLKLMYKAAKPLNLNQIHFGNLSNNIFITEDDFSTSKTQQQNTVTRMNFSNGKWKIIKKQNSISNNNKQNKINILEIIFDKSSLENMLQGLANINSRIILFHQIFDKGTVKINLSINDELVMSRVYFQTPLLQIYQFHVYVIIKSQFQLQIFKIEQ